MAPSTDLEDKAAIVTGASQGIGRATAEALGAAGARVTMVARREELLNEAVTSLRARGVETVAVAGDVRDEGTVERMVADTVTAFGGVDVLVNNAGASWSDTFHRGPLADLTVEDLRGAMDLNVATAFSCSKAVAPIMQERGGGAIVNVASIAARHPMPAYGFYSPAKAALVSLTVLMAIEWAPDIRVNAVLPGHIDTARSAASRTPEVVARLQGGIALGRLGTPDDVAGAVAYLASERAAWVSGTALDVNGGLRVL